MKHSNATQQMDILNKEIIQQTFHKLLPQHAFKNPVMACVWVGTVLTLVATLIGNASLGFGLALSLILLVTVLFANYAEAVAEAKGRGQAASLRQARENLTANRILDLNAIPTVISANLLKKDDLVIVKAGEIVPADGEIIQGFATINESAVTGESAPVLREANTDRSGVIGGTKVLSDEIIIRVSNEAGHSFLDRMIALVEGANRQKTPNEIALSILLNIMTITFIVVVLTLPVIGSMVGIKISMVLLIALLVCLIPTTIGGLLPAIGIAGMNRALKANVLAKSGKAVEVAGDIDVLLLDKTGTITYGDRQATAFYPLAGVTPSELRQAAMLTSFADPTPEGKSIISLGKELGESIQEPKDAEFIQFSASTRLSGVDLATGQKIRKGAVDAILNFTHQEIKDNIELKTRVEQVASKGATPLVVASNHNILGVIELSDVIKQGIKERFALLREMGIKTIMVTGDNPLTAAAIAAEAGVDDYIAEARPEDKLACIRNEQAAGKLVAMVGDGTNDAPALAQADIGLAMNSGTQAAKEAGNMVDLDSDPTKLLDVVEIGKQQLITRGALTTFSLANDVSKYFVILPALFAVAIPQLGVLNILQLSSPSSAVISALIFNALIIPMLIPLALKGVQFKPASALQLLRRNMLIYGVGGVIFPFIVIKLIDLVVSLWI
ncbi:potassium-transporting ATPase subunit KdpB [Acinetobacter tjernbergiae]|uniref:Potassium-transporting ATPase ATP-binding subunit n=1 Tax=Acinetobacter tjernbergiae DSM 14971 = CIP 107465 TaxID=1120928 RepID=V2UYT5_9GAMM|nr:potassium-transporting ATPase subunit KdpB [Acinetobacter tjernbergiae]ESK55187.1 potassium-transporting ATPase B chain [Acinetobacter tjernbergiae DSM 14971 = CIP 107465]